MSACNAAKSVVSDPVSEGLLDIEDISLPGPGYVLDDNHPKACLQAGFTTALCMLRCVARFLFGISSVQQSLLERVYCSKTQPHLMLMSCCRSSVKRKKPQMLGNSLCAQRALLHTQEPGSCPALVCTACEGAAFMHTGCRGILQPDRRSTAIDKLHAKLRCKLICLKSQLSVTAMQPARMSGCPALCLKVLSSC